MAQIPVRDVGAFNKVYMKEKGLDTVPEGLHGGVVTKAVEEEVKPVEVPVVEPTVVEPEVVATVEPVEPAEPVAEPVEPVAEVTETVEPPQVEEVVVTPDVGTAES